MRNLNLVMLKDKKIIWLFLAYMLCQLGSLFLGVGLFLIVYIVLYFITLVYFAITTSITLIQKENLKVIFNLLFLAFAANLILFLIYIPTLIYNPDINWHLKGEAEQDPMILQAYFPPIFFTASLAIVILTGVITKIILSLRKAKVAE